jgi:hypothetical protein
LLAKLNTWRLLSARSALKLEMFCRCFSFVRDFLVFDNLPLIEAAEASFLDSRDMVRRLSAPALPRRPGIS